MACLAIILVRSLDFEPRNELPSALINQPFPTFELPMLGNSEVATNAELPNELFLFNVWATWCFPCREEHPVLLAMKEDGYAVVGLNYKDDDEKALSWLSSYGDPFEMTLVDQLGSLGIDLGVYGVPSTFVVDKAGQIRYKHVGPITMTQWDRDLKPIVQSIQRQDATT